MTEAIKLSETVLFIERLQEDIHYLKQMNLRLNVQYDLDFVEEGSNVEEERMRMFWQVKANEKAIVTNERLLKGLWQWVEDWQTRFE